MTDIIPVYTEQQKVIPMGFDENYRPPQIEVEKLEQSQEMPVRIFLKAKMFRFYNIYQSYDEKHECLRMIDIDIAVCDTQAI